MENRSLGIVKFLLVIGLFTGSTSFGQVTELAGATTDRLPSYYLSFYGEGYGGISTYSSRQFQEDFYYNHHTLRKPSLNYASVLFEKKLDTWQFQLGIHDGIYVRRNYADQPKLSQLLSHANLQYTFPKKPSFKIMAGVFPSHIGFEAVRSDANLTASRSMLAENSPYYESGLQLQYAQYEKPWKLGVHLLTGWQQAQIVMPIKHISWGYNFEYAITPYLTLNYNGFIGYLNTASEQRRSYQNFYATLNTDKWKTIWGFDQGSMSISHQNHQWISPVFIVQHHWKKQLNWAFRYEYMQTFSDPLFLVDQNTLFDRRNATSVNLDFNSKKNWLWRLEYKQAWGLGYQPGNKDMHVHWNNLILLSLSKSFQLAF